MSKKSLLPQSPRHILVYDEDWQYLLDEYGPYSASKLGVSPAIRSIVHYYVKRLRAKTEEALNEMAQAADASPGAK